MLKKPEPIKKSALQLIKEVMYHVERKSPTKDEMLYDIKMMNFKIRPVSGDVFSLARQNVGFMESLWRIGKIEEIVVKAMNYLDRQELGIFFNYMDSMEAKLQRNIARSMQDMTPQQQRDFQSVTMEVFRERAVKKMVN